MALLGPLGRAARACLSALRPRTLAGGGACGPRRVPACPPCRPAPQPQCRAHPSAARLAQRVVCCAPPQGQRPPCAPREPARPITCSTVDQKIKPSVNRASSSRIRGRSPLRIESSECECDQDPVAQRIQLAKRARRVEYEREVAGRAARSRRAPPVAHYRLSGERECARATDGCTYAVLRASARAAPRSRCGPGRTPPPPRCVELAPDDGCRIKGEAHLDPCAHRPRVIIEIDRSANTKKTASSGPQSSTSDSGRVTLRADKPNWCAKPPPPAPAPQRCRHPTIVERLRARPPISQNERRVHTSVELFAAGKSGSLEGMLLSKEQLKEAGLGRVIIDEGIMRGDQVKPPGGRLEMSVPPGTERVAVLVSLESAASGSCYKESCAGASSTPSCAPRLSSSCSNVAAAKESTDSWMSLKKIQKKLKGRCNEGSATGVTGPQLPRADEPARCTPPSPPSLPVARSGGPPNKSQSETKRCSSTSTFLANTVVVSS